MFKWIKGRWQCFWYNHHSIVKMHVAGHSDIHWLECQYCGHVMSETYLDVPTKGAMNLSTGEYEDQTKVFKRACVINCENSRRYK